MENFDERENDKHSDKFNIKFISEYCHGQAGLHDSLTDPVIYPFNLGLPQRAKKHLQNLPR